MKTSEVHLVHILTRPALPTLGARVGAVDADGTAVNLATVHALQRLVGGRGGVKSNKAKAAALASEAIHDNARVQDGAELLEGHTQGLKQRTKEKEDTDMRTDSTGASDI